MKLLKKSLKIAMFILFINIAYSSSTISKITIYSGSLNLRSEIEGLDNENVTIYMFCYIKSGKVDHHCPHEFWKGTCFGIYIKIGTGVGTFGIGSLYMHLTGEDDEQRLTVSKILGTTTYTEDVNMAVKGFIGVFQPTGGLSDGLLYGFSLVTRIIPL